ncbi:transcription factor EB-like [Centruroides sculpturatus]|uniref:transcription factor EB-like n=1 Tax=Centruroides sculpturatus TaxID=218467 RepID=UPI000C6D4977|nr:transcription factor EB-like [Centruroides sculpturatus]
MEIVNCLENSAVPSISLDFASPEMEIWKMPCRFCQCHNQPSEALKSPSAFKLTWNFSACNFKAVSDTALVGFHLRALPPHVCCLLCPAQECELEFRFSPPALSQTIVFTLPPGGLGINISMTMISRTNLKQQLQREQTQEQEKKEAEQRQLLIEQRLFSCSAPSSSSSAISVPSAAIVKLPRQVLQVQSRLENPTQYHVIQSQKRQVHQYLSNTHGASGKSLQDSAVGSSPQVVPVSPIQLQNKQEPTPNSPLSVAPSSSAATSPSEIPGNTNIINLFASIPVVNKVSASCPAEVTRIKEEPALFTEIDIHALKDRQKKDNHNMIERRRRYNINDRIKELGTLLPRNNDPYSELTRDVRQNKGTILKASVDYLRRLKQEVEKIPIMEEKHRILEQQNKKLLLKIQELEYQMKMHGVNECNVQTQNRSNISKQQAPLLNQTVKKAFDENLNRNSSESPNSYVCQNEELAMDEEFHSITSDPMLSWNATQDLFSLEKMDVLS